MPETTTRPVPIVSSAPSELCRRLYTFRVVYRDTQGRKRGVTIVSPDRDAARQSIETRPDWFLTLYTRLL